MVKKISYCFCLFKKSISPTFYECICADILVPKKVQTLNVSTKKLRAKLLYKKAAHKMLVKLTPGFRFEKKRDSTYCCVLYCLRLCQQILCGSNFIQAAIAIRVKKKTRQKNPDNYDRQLLQLLDEF
jgi:hypothetical protein